MAQRGTGSKVIKAPEPDLWDWKRTFRNKVQGQFAGQTLSKTLFTDGAGRAKIQAAREETNTAMGYSLQQAAEAEAMEDIVREMSWRSEDPVEAMAETAPSQTID